MSRGTNMSREIKSLVINRIFGCLLVIIFIFNCVTAFSKEESLNLTNDEDLRVAQAYLNGIGIATDFISDQSMTRAKFISLLLEVCNYPVMKADGFNDFEDVSETSIYADGIYTALKMGIISSKTLKFQPESPIVFIEALRLSADNESFSVVGSSYFRNDQEYILSSFDFSPQGQPRALVHYGQGSKTVDEYSETAIVERIVTVFQPDGIDELVDKKIYLWSAGKFSDYYVCEDVSLLKPSGREISLGDIIRFELKTDNVISNITVDYDAEIRSFTPNGNSLVLGDSGYNKLISYGFSSVYKRTGNICFVSSVKENGVYDYSIENLRMINLISAKCVKVDLNKKTIVPIYNSEIIDYSGSGVNASEILTRQRHWACNLAIVYKEGE